MIYLFYVIRGKSFLAFYCIACHKNSLFFIFKVGSTVWKSMLRWEMFFNFFGAISGLSS